MYSRLCARSRDCSCEHALFSWNAHSCVGEERGEGKGGEEEGEEKMGRRSKRSERASMLNWVGGHERPSQTDNI